jgi:hypothetical protein
MYVKKLLMAALALMLYGCLSVGKPFDSEDLSWIIKNQTTKEDVFDELGEPFRVGRDSGKLTWTYGYYKYNLNGSTRTKDLTIYFNKDSVVDSYTFYTSFPEEKEKWKNK